MEVVNDRRVAIHPHLELLVVQSALPREVALSKCLLDHVMIGVHVHLLLVIRRGRAAAIGVVAIGRGRDNVYAALGMMVVPVLGVGIFRQLGSSSG